MAGHNAVGTPSGARRCSADGKIALGLQSQTSVRQAASVRATYSTAKELNEKAVAFAEANVNAGFELAQRLLQAKDPQEMGTIYQNHLKEQMEKMNAQFRELGSAMTKSPPVDLK